MLTITEIFAFVAEDEGESLLSIRSNRTRLPLIATESETVNRMAVMARQEGRPYRILRFSERADITENLPKRSHKSGSISAISVILTTDEDGDEELVTSPDRHVPLAAVFPQGVRAMVQVAEVTGQPFRVVRFSGREDVTERFVSPGAP